MGGVELLVGIVLGLSLSLAVAPRTFLLSPVGTKCLKCVGTRSLFWARVVCLLVVLPLASLQALFAIGLFAVR
jgi:hypothetical protein